MTSENIAAQAATDHLPAQPYARPLDVEQARRTLDDLMARVGVDGLVAALQAPGLLAQVDQHAAAVRDAAHAAAGRLEPLALARYARSIMAAAERMGHQLPDDPDRVDWFNPGWFLLRLAAVCALAAEAGLL